MPSDAAVKKYLFEFCKVASLGEKLMVIRDDTIKQITQISLLMQLGQLFEVSNCVCITYETA